MSARGSRLGLAAALLVAAAGIGAPAAQPAGKGKPSTCAEHRQAFKRFSAEVTTRCSGGLLYVSSNGLPDHEVMVGITRWIWQVPLPQPYVGENSLRIPLRPRVARQITESTGKGAVGVAVNGIPIFKPTDGSGIYTPEHDPNLTGELDHCGGHAGGADDYHYHYGSDCLVHELGSKGALAGYAIDGFPIYGYREPDGDKHGKLDRCNGHRTKGLGYHYHFTRDRPYVVLCYRGTPAFPNQPATTPVRMPHGPEAVTITAATASEQGGTVQVTSGAASGGVGWTMTSPSCWFFSITEPGRPADLENHCRP